MKFKKIMLVSIILLAILTVGAVSANDDVDFNETLTVEQTQEASINASFDDNLNDFEDDVLSSSQDEDLLEDEIAAENLHPWVSSHESVDADWNPWIVCVHGDDVVDAGTVNLTIFDDGGDCIFTGLKHFPDDADENNDIIWRLDELRENNILNDAKTYAISLKYLVNFIRIVRLRLLLCLMRLMWKFTLMVRMSHTLLKMEIKLPGLCLTWISLPLDIIT